VRGCFGGGGIRAGMHIPKQLSPHPFAKEWQTLPPPHSGRVLPHGGYSESVLLAPLGTGHASRVREHLPFILP